MCGICGFYSKRDISMEQLAAMNNTMKHRGPNDKGTEMYMGKDHYSVGLAHRRLSILDLSILGHQPMNSVDHRITIVFNGEIYNYLELKEELKDYPFKSTCDSEVILAAYLKWGLDCVHHFNGMFAIAIYDREDQTLHLMRDPIGKKPLYYWLDGENLVFASELKAIMVCPGFTEKLRQDYLVRFLTNQYINAPDSIFQNVYKLEPGSILSFCRGKVETKKYWDVAKLYEEKKNTFQGSFAEAKEELKKKLQRSVALRMISDVPLGTFLSGGYDSSLVTALAQDASEQPVKTFSIGFEDKSHNEAEYAKEVAKHLGTNHTELYIGEQDMFDLIQDLCTFYDEPFADSSQIPTMMVSKLAKQQVTVALSGDGGDEFFCGYNNYKMLQDMQKLDSVGTLVYDVCQMPGFKQMKLMEMLPGKVQIVAGNQENPSKVQPFGLKQSQVAEKMVLGDSLTYRFPDEQQFVEKDWMIRRMLLDMVTYLPGDILCKVDRASMRYSLENRCPILDKHVMEFSFTLPHKYKYHNGSKKYILKELAYDYIPKELLERPKVGFSVPLDQWLRGPLREELQTYSASNFLEKQGIFAPDYTAKFIGRYLSQGDKGAGSGENYSRMVWAFYVFQKWWAQYRNVIQQ
ncbi:MAG: asparagine synthase (glutamine-hydrolyzing) [Lachnospiraceae bacterium]|nr:asparagine synthase (glutamine-hydrolyzing) [Lachnospiraceae bacterium]